MNTQVQITPDWSLQDLCIKWGCTMPTVYARINEGKLKAIKIGKNTRVTDDARVDYENSNPYIPR